MNMKTNVYIFLFLFFLCHIGPLFGVDIGSDTAVTRFNTQQTVNDGDRVAGFAAIQGGLYFENPFVSGIFDSFFPASGSINLNDGELILNRDLILYNESYFDQFGSIVGNNHVLELSASMTCIPSPASGVGGVVCDVTELLSEAQDAGVLSVAWSINDDFVAVGLITNLNQELLIYSFDGESTLTLEDSISYLQNVNIVRWHPTEYRLTVGTTSNAIGPELFMYDFDSVTGTLTLTDSVDLAINVDVRALAWRPEGDYLAVGTTDNAAEVYVYPVSGAGIFGTPVSIDLGGTANVRRGALSWSISGDYIAVGRTLSGSPELYVLAFDTAGPSLVSNVSLDVGGDANGVSWSPTYSSRLAVGLGDGTTRLSVYNHDGDAGTLTQIASAAETTSPVRYVDWSQDSGCLFIVKEVQPADQELKVYGYNNTIPTLTFIEEFNFSANMFTVRTSKANSYVMVGGADDAVTIYQKTSVLIGDKPYTLTDITIKLNSDVCLDLGKYIFLGNSTINGQGNSLTINPTSTLVIGANAGLLFKNIRVLDMDRQHLSFVDNSSTASFQNVELNLDEDFTMTVGNVHIIRDLKVTGNGYTFIYQSPDVIRVFNEARLILDDGVTFSYDPLSGSPNLLQFTDASSQLVLQGATLHASTAGLNLIKGTMIVDQKSFISAAGTIPETAINFGDGLSSSNNFCVRWLPASVLEAMPGYIRLQNV